jgi:S-adenosylmethionine synthetase
MTTSDKIIYTKFAAKIITTLGVSKVVHDIVQHTATAETFADQAKIWVGSFVLGGMACEVASEHVDRRIDEIADAVVDYNIKKFNESKMEYKSNR